MIDFNKPYSLTKLKKELSKNSYKDGLLFCFGTSLISKLIMAKTRLNCNEIVPSHVAMVIHDKGNDLKYIYESTTMPDDVGKKTIRGGVRRYLLSDFFKIEVSKGTTYVYVPHEINVQTAEAHIHRPYGIDSIGDFLIKNESDGDSNGLICSQYANMCTGITKQLCPSPADMYRKLRGDNN